MFEKLFGLKPRQRPEDFAGQLIAIAYEASLQEGFHKLLGLTEAERNRCMWSTYVFVTTLPIALATYQRRAELTQFLLEVYTWMLNAWPLRDGVVRLGGYIVSPYELLRLPEALERTLGRKIPGETIEDHRIRFCELMDAVGGIRVEQQTKAMKESVKSGPPSLHAPSLYNLLGIDLQWCVFREESFSGVSGREIMDRASAFASLAEQLFKRTLLVYNTL